MSAGPSGTTEFRSPEELDSPAFLRKRAAKSSPQPSASRGEAPPNGVIQVSRAEDFVFVGAPQKLEIKKGSREDLALAQIQAVQAQIGTGETVRGNSDAAKAKKRVAEGAIITAQKDEIEKLQRTMNQAEEARSLFEWTLSKITTFQKKIANLERRSMPIPAEARQELEQARMSLAADEDYMKKLAVQTREYPERLQKAGQGIALEKREQKANADQCRTLQAYVREYQRVRTLETREAEKTLLQRKMEGTDLNGDLETNIDERRLKSQFLGRIKDLDLKASEFPQLKEVWAKFRTGELNQAQISAIQFDGLQPGDVILFDELLAGYNKLKLLVIKAQTDRYSQKLQRAAREIEEIKHLIPRPYKGKSEGAQAVAALTTEIFERFPPPKNLARVTRPREQTDIRIVADANETITQPPAELGLDKLTGDKKNALRKQAIEILDTITRNTAEQMSIPAGSAKGWLLAAIRELTQVIPGAARNPDLLGRQLVWYMAEDIVGSAGSVAEANREIKQIISHFASWPGAERILRSVADGLVQQRGSPEPFPAVQSFEPRAAAQNVQGIFPQRIEEEETQRFNIPDDILSNWRAIQQIGVVEGFNDKDLMRWADATVAYAGEIFDNENLAPLADQMIEVAIKEMRDAGIPESQIKKLFDDAKLKWARDQARREVR